MTLAEVNQRLAKESLFEEALLSSQNNENKTTLQIEGLSGSLKSFFILSLYQRNENQFFIITPTADEAAYIAADIGQISEVEKPCLLYLPTANRPYDSDQISDKTVMASRADILQQIAGGYEGIIITSAEAWYERVPAPEETEDESIKLAVGETVDLQKLTQELHKAAFELVEFAEEPGEFALRGGILDVFPYTSPYPIRIEFFGDEIDSIREYDPVTQRSISKQKQVRIVPDMEGAAHGEKSTTSIIKYLSPACTIVFVDEIACQRTTTESYDKVQSAWERLVENNQDTHWPAPEKHYHTVDALIKQSQKLKNIIIGRSDRKNLHKVQIASQPQPSMNSSMKMLRQYLADRPAEQHYIFCENKEQEFRLEDLLEKNLHESHISVGSIHEGFYLPKTGLNIWTDHQIWGRFHRPALNRHKKQQGGLSIRDLQRLNPGDFVVHIDFGIGKFAGMHEIEVRGKKQEAVKVLFHGSDILYVNVNSLHKLHKYSGKDGRVPKLTKLGTQEWERTKSKTKKKIKTMARDLIKLYAQRRLAKGFAYPEDSVWQRELEASFKYEDTPDQYSASEAVKKDMTKVWPMDRLVCGDVGFGKTEIAVRAAFKAAQEGKQVAILVPTTILAAQHYKTFTERLSEFPVQVGVLSRFQTKAEAKKTVENVKSGAIDIVIGTHRLVSKDVQFADLGLLIIDEEQRFGVKVKETLRKMRVNVDTLILTATPIPRTLQFSLLGARDLSIMQTPPPNRQPITTEIHTFNQDLIREAITYEINRGGQVYFVHNRVKSIDQIAAMIQAVVPQVRMMTAHGQMKPRYLEQVMADFQDHKFDVLVSTNIVESGLDIPNANTIILNNAERFGLAELHQLRGRVGRSNTRAFCYLLTPSTKALTRDSRRRLQAIEEFTALGSGFSIAMRDLDIRGAGNLLGEDQSGVIMEVGYETYQKILEEAVAELKNEEFADTFVDENEIPPAGETLVEVDNDTLLPEHYISSRNERLNLYRKLGETETAEQVIEFGQELVDRFGPAPEEVSTLLNGVLLKVMLEPLRIPKIVYKNNRLFLDMPKAEDKWFYDNLFQPLLKSLHNLDNRYVLKEVKKKMKVIIQNVASLEAAIEVAKKIIPKPSGGE